MKTVLLLIGMVICGTGFSQTKGFIQGGVSTQNNIFTQDAKLGMQFDGKHQIAVTGETFDIYKRQYLAGLEYGKLFNGGGRNSVLLTVGGKVNTSTGDLLVEPGVGYNMFIANGVSLQPSISTKFDDGSTVGRNIPLKAGVGLQLSF